MSTLKIVGIFSLGLTIGGAIGSAVSYFYLKKKFDKQIGDELAETREYYEKKFEELEAKLPVEETVKAEADSDGIVTVGKGIPEEKKVDTHAIAYDKQYKQIMDRVKEVKERVHPSEDDGDEDEEGVIEITELGDDGIPGYGDIRYYETVEAEYYTENGGFKVTNWGSLAERYNDTTDDEFEQTEDLLRGDILPLLQEFHFDKRPYDITFVRDNKQYVDVKIVKVDGTGGETDY